jgi:threonine synthase
MSVLYCRNCGNEGALLNSLNGCLNCLNDGIKHPVEIKYNLKNISKNFFKDSYKNKPHTIWRWSELLPESKNKITLGEGNTPLIESKSLASKLNIDRFFFKYEGSNPTGSFKDRLNAIAFSKGKDFKKKYATVASSGNQGVSLAAYSFAANMKSLIFCPPYVEEKIIKELLLRNSTPVILSEYGDPALKVVEELVNKFDYYVSTRNFPRPFANPYGLEGYKTISFEIYEQLTMIPDKIFVPTGGGDSIYGVWKGFREIYHAGIVAKQPQMFACQTKLGGDSLVKSFKSKSKNAAIVKSGDSKAISIRVNQSGDHGLWAINESKGGAYSITEPEIDEALTITGNHGLCVDPSCAVSLAGVLKSKKEKKLRKSDVVICLLTASGLRWNQSMSHLDRFKNSISQFDPRNGKINNLLKNI